MNLQDIADRLHISRSTVSRALRNDERISTKTRQLVTETAAAMGYKANPYLSVLMANLREGALPSASPIIAFLNPASDHQSWHLKKPFLYTFNGAKERAKELGFTLEEFLLGQSGMTGQRLRSILLARNIRAVILAGHDPADPSKAFDSEGFAAVSIDASQSTPHLHSVAPDFLGNTFKAIQSLRSLGYQRIGLALEQSELARMRNLPRMAFLEHEHTLPERERIGFWVGPPSDLRGFAHWLETRRPDAIISSDWLPQKWLQPLGLRIPEDIGVAQLDPLFYPFQNSGIDGRFEQIGAAAVDLVVSQIASNNFSAPQLGNTMLTKGAWRHGWSTRDKTADILNATYPPTSQSLLNAANLAPSPKLAATRADARAEQESQHFPLARSSEADSWRFIPLGPIANSPFEAPAWPPRFPDTQPMPPFQELSHLRGIPFQFPSAQKTRQKTCIALHPQKAARDPANRSIPLEPNLRIRALYFCHFSFYGWYGDPLAGHYTIRYRDGSCHKIELRSYHPPLNPASQATHQDSWIAHPQFETPACKHFLLHSQTNPFENDRYGYVLEYQLPEPKQPVTAIEFETNPDSDTAILLVALTLLVDP